jgi:hypothetical protein
MQENYKFETPRLCFKKKGKKGRKEEERKKERKSRQASKQARKDIRIPSKQSCFLASYPCSRLRI